MTFSASFAAPFQNPFPSAAAAAVNRWWLSGGIVSANCIGAYAAKGAASLAASYTNLANPGTYDLTLGVAPTWDAVNGWIFNGSTQYLRTGIVNASGWALICKFADAPATGNTIVCGCQTTTTTKIAVSSCFDALGAGAFYQNGSHKLVLPVLTTGVLAVSGQIAYRNGVAESGNIGAWSGTNTRDPYIGAYNANGSAAYFSAVKVQAVAIYNTNISAAQVLAVVNAINAL